MNQRTSLALTVVGTILVLSVAGLVGGSLLSLSSRSSEIKDVSVDKTTSPSTSTAGSTLNEDNGKRVIKDYNISIARTVLITGEINQWAMENATFELQNIDQTDGDIFVLISSPGGSVYAGEGFITAMQSARNHVYTVCMNLCASMGAIIHQYGFKRLAYDRSILMFHDASGGFQGKFGEMRQLMNMLSRKLEKTNRTIAKRSKLSYDQFASLVQKDLWLDAEDSQAQGLVDDIIKVVPLRQPPTIMFEDNRKRTKLINGDNPINILPMTFGVIGMPNDITSK